jgi:limonene 1,2-monooxygenase
MPHFTGASAAPLASENWQFGKSATWRDQTAAAIGRAVQDHAAGTSPATASS